MFFGRGPSITPFGWYNQAPPVEDYNKGGVRMNFLKARHRLCGLVLCCFAPAVLAQTETASLSGRVTDPHGAAVPHAVIEAIENSTNSNTTTETNHQGLYYLPSLRPGSYRLVVSKEGFKQIVQGDVVLHVQDGLTLNFGLQIGTVNETVTVTGGAPLINTRDASVGTVIDRGFVRNLPLNGRTFQTLIALTPGVVLTAANAIDLGQFSVNGQRADSNYFTVDGVSANVAIPGISSLGSMGAGALPTFTTNGSTTGLVSVDAMEEFKVQTSSYAPEFGRQPGGQVQILTRSGTNAFRGTLFEYFRNDVLDAKDWFVGYNRTAKAAERHNDFGGVFGGPIVPNRTFFFVSYEGFRLRVPQARTTVVPSLSTRQAAPAGIQPFLNAFPLPNTPASGANVDVFNASYSEPSTSDAGSLRIDHLLTNSLKLFGRYSASPSERAVRSTPASVVNRTSLQTHAITAGLTWAVRPTMTNDFRFNWTRNKAEMIGLADNLGGAVPPPDSALFQTGSHIDSSMGFGILGLGQVGVGPFGRNRQRQLNFVDSVAIAKGAHEFRFGADYRYLSPDFGGVKTSTIALFPNLNFALAGIAGFSIVGASDPITIAFHNASFFAQDTWNVHPRLTLTYGLRWELNPPPHGKDGKDLITARGIDNPTSLTLAPAGTPLYNTNYKGFAPRLGLAYRLADRGSWTTVLRGGVGLFYDLGSGEAATASGTFPYSRFKLLFGVPFPLSPSNAAPPPFDPNPPVVSFVLVFDPNLGLPLTYQWNVALEQSLGSQQAVTLSYVGSAGRRLLQQELLTAPNPRFTNISITRNTGTSDYHALQLQYLRKLSRGLQALASYTWSHSLDTASHNTFDQGGGTRGNSDFDIRNTFNAAITYSIPAPAANALASAFLHGWSADTVFFARSATPVNINAGSTLVGPLNQTQRPDLVPGQPLYVNDPALPGGRKFNPAAFSVPPPGRQGTFGRNVLRGFGAWQLDLAVHRTFSMTEKVNLQLRAEMFNIFNHPNFGDPFGAGAFILSPVFGQSSSTLAGTLGLGGQGLNPLFQIGGPRQVQLALKFNF